MITNSISQPGKLIATAVGPTVRLPTSTASWAARSKPGFTQSDVAYWACERTGTFDG